MLFPFFWLRSTGFPFAWLGRLALPVTAELKHPTSHDEDAYHRHVVQSRRTLVQLLSDPAAVEALLLSNPESLERVAQLTDADLDRPNARTRQRLRLAWCYLQRFCAKNETYSFFGPVTWGTIDRASPAVVSFAATEPEGDQLVRRVCMEQWVVDQLCVMVKRSPALRAVLPLRLNPGCDVDGDVLCYPLGKRARLAGDELAFLSVVQNEPAEARKFADSPAARRLTKAGIVQPHLAVPPGVEESLKLIGDILRAGTHGGEQVPTVRLITELEDLRARFTEADCDRRRDLLGHMTAMLAAAGADTRRARGKTYVGRFPIYEDCARGITVQIGGSLARELEDGLAPAMRLFRAVAECVAARLHASYQKVLSKLPFHVDGTTDFVQFLAAVRPVAANDACTAVAAEVRAILETAWSRLVDETVEQQVLEQDDLETIASAVRRVTPGYERFSGVLGVGVMSPDVMLAAASVSALREGSLRIVLGEVHPCVLAGLQPVALPFLGQHKEALRHADALLAPGRVLLAATSHCYQRAQFAWPVVPNLWEVVLPDGASRCPAARQIPAGRGRVVNADGLIRFVDRQGGRTEDIVTVLSSDLHRVMFAVAADVLGRALPARLMYRSVCLKRRTWAFDASELPSAPYPAERFQDYLTLRRWAQERDLPRHVFFRVDTETKPVYVDWENALAVDTFVKFTRRARRVHISEMSPDPSELWFSGGSGRHCCELRMSMTV